ncbi:annexin, putative [Ricinus communis]|uniref:Annexin, putative n=1 Tax=Ricinus communis TaxID=3988 RepID=B9SM17_RICCO|nr:annexin, putative [Ricinus communis]|eukprot:XP_002527036.1 annexin D8 [Ricinus communis]
MATIIVPKDFSPVEDAENIKRACLGWGTDEKAIISILGHRNSFQRKLIRLAYEEIYQEDLIFQLKSELSGNFERAVCLWTLEPADRDAVLANEALQKVIPDYRVIVEISCVSSPEDLLAIRRAYRFRYKHSLEEDVASHTTGDIRKLLVALVSAYGYDGPEIDEKVAHLEADILRDNIFGKAFNHEEFIRILTTRSKAQLKATFNYYKDIHGTSITKVLLVDHADQYLAALRMVIRCIGDPKKYFAKVLRYAINTEGTDEDALSRVIVTHAEKDLEEIKELYLKRNNVSLDVAVGRDTSGDYKAFLLALLGNDNNLDY